MFTKKRVFVSSLIILVLGYFAVYAPSFCYSAYKGGIPVICLEDIGFILFYCAFSVLVISILTYKMRDEVFRAWISFTKWGVPLQIFLALIFPVSGGGYLISIDKQFAAIILSILFVIISLILIAWKYVAARHGTLNS